ncbi:DNA translocase FtsK [Candidatus Dependentiae bacterium]|nr:DNA translocase FtsK [Candidatus Dependentiae bacterium]
MYFHKLMKKILFQLFCFSVLTVMFISLISFNSNDLCFFFESSSHYAAKNWLGNFGAIISSTLLYFFGFSAFLFCIFFGYLLFAPNDSKYLKQNFDRLVALLILPFLSAVLFYSYNLEFFSKVFAGGLFGYLFYLLFSTLFEDWQIKLLMYVLILADLIIILRFDWFFKLKVLFKKFQFSFFKKFIANINHLSRSAVFKVQKIFGKKIEVSMPNLNSANFETEKITEPINSDNKDLPDYILPNSSFFELKKLNETESKFKEGEEKAKLLEEKLTCFGIHGYIKSIIKGPVVTLYEYEPNIDTKISKIIARENDLALALQALSLRIIAPIPGKSVVGFEVSNSIRKAVHFNEIVHSQLFENFRGTLPLILGKCTIGNDVIVDLAKMPHLLVAGSTGAGKSVALNAMLMSLLCKLTPDELKLILIDPKRLEFAAYADIAHLLFPIITDPNLAISALSYAVDLMEYRYRLMAENNVRNIAEYQKLVNDSEPMPYIVIIIDELSDLMMRAGKDVENSITRLSQMARAAGIHLIVATQRPSVDVITGLIKVNFPCRIAFKVTSKIDSRTIIDCSGADKLLGKGDMLFLDSTGVLRRLHGALVTDSEIENVVGFIKKQRLPNYEELVCIRLSGDEIDEADEVLLDQAVQFLQTIDEVSISLLQRKFRIGYNKSARLIDILESKGHIAPGGSGKRRKVIKYENS